MRAGATKGPLFLLLGKAYFGTCMKGGVSYVLAIIIFYAAAAVSAQAQTRQHLAVYYGAGQVLKHTTEVPNVGRFGLNTFALQMGWQTRAKKQWAKLHHQPEIGFVFFYNQFEAQPLGSSFALIPYIGRDLPILKSNLSFNYHLGIGLAGLTRYYDSISNPLNENISTPLNGAVDLRLGLRYKIANALALSAQASFTHYSNAGFKLPNYGINVGQVMLGLAYNWGPLVQKTKEKPRVNNTQEWLVALNFGYRQMVLSEEYYAVQNLSVERNWLLKGKNRFGLGLAVFNDATHQEYNIWANLWGNGNHQRFDWYQTLNWGLYANYEMVFNRFSGYLQAGAYLGGAYRNFSTSIDYLNNGQFITHNVALTRSYFFNRFGFRYRLKKHLVANISLKAHLLQAQFIEVGLGTYF